MRYRSPESPAERAFRESREEWLEARVHDLAEVMEKAGAQLYGLLPSDFGDQRHVAAATIARVAADQARARSVADTVRWLERLIPGAHPHDLTDSVRELRARLAPGDEPALWSWNAGVWDELLLWWWRRNQRRTGDLEGDFAEWTARWSVPFSRIRPLPAPERAPRAHGRELLTLAEFLTHEPEPLSLLARAVLDAPETAATVQDVVLLREEHLQGAGHLLWLAEQQVCAEELEAWRRKQQANGSEATRAFLAELSEAVKRYMSVVLQPVIAELSGCERALLSHSKRGPWRSAEDYLGAFLDFLDWQGQAQDDTEVERQATELAGQGRTTWHGMEGSLPVWYHIVTSPQERAAAKAYSGAPSESVLRVRTGAPVQASFDLFPMDLWNESGEHEAEWYPEPGIDIHYDGDSAFDLSALLAVARLGYARLEFLAVGADGGVQRLRTVLARVREEDTPAWRRWALASLAVLAPEPDDLADAITRQDDDGADQGADDAEGWDDDEEPAARRTPEKHVARPAGGLPPALLGKVRALLRQAEDPGVTEPEARTFLDKAAELMAKYGIERAMLDDVSDPGKPVDKVVDVHPPYVKEARRLLSWIAGEMRCTAVYPGGKANRHRVHLFGFEADLHAVEVLFTSLRLQMLRGADAADFRHRPEGEDARAYKRSWMLGFIREVITRIGAAQRAARAAADTAQRTDPLNTNSGGRSVALVLADRSAVVAAQVSARYPKIAKARPTKFKGTGYWQGVADGKHAEIGGPAFAEEDDMDQLTH